MLGDARNLTKSCIGEVSSGTGQVMQDDYEIAVRWQEIFVWKGVKAKNAFLLILVHSLNKT